jgi:hypothetical protein
VPNANDCPGCTVFHRLDQGGRSAVPAIFAMKLKPIKLVDAQEMARQHPDTFEVPSGAELRKLRKGDLVKVSNHAERFWVEIVSRDGDLFVGRVDNFLAGTVSHDDLIEFHVCNVYDILPPPHRKTRPILCI